MYTILVAIDGSKHSWRAVDYAAQRTRSAPCKIELLHVETPVMAWEIGAVSPVEAVLAARDAQSRELLDAGAGKFDQTIEVEKIAVSGEPARTILEQATKLGVDEIVMGSRGLRPLDAVLLGSVAYKVLHDAKVAVVVVH
jgi:nucleotide-binding universal stress UspA family protein